MDLGTKIKQMRIVLNLTQEELANRCELTKSYISQLENNKTSPSIQTLTHILEVLGSNLSSFFHEDNISKMVFNEDEQYEANFEGYDMTWLVPTSQKLAMEPVLVVLKPHSKTIEDMPHDGEEFGYVIKGEIVVSYGNYEEVVKENEAFYITTDKGHYVKNNTNKEARIIWVSCPPNF